MKIANILGISLTRIHHQSNLSLKPIKIHLKCRELNYSHRCLHQVKNQLREQLLELLLKFLRKEALISLTTTVIMEQLVCNLKSLQVVEITNNIKWKNITKPQSKILNLFLKCIRIKQQLSLNTFTNSKTPISFTIKTNPWWWTPKIKWWTCSILKGLTAKCIMKM